ncbi:hypothetical protein FKW77_005128 [Venturia effusa]|uniref:Uncharacterized protein n=1 Tax=Venturia effusa TaxID=50376 RepID=A0A517LLI3_9PEZI|nr:hypothetical protein FKW77_005128 [Venturia effusa]
MYAYPSPPVSPSEEYQPSSPNYGASKPSCVPYQGNPTYNCIPTSPVYIRPSSGHMKPAKDIKYTQEAQVFKQMMLESEAGTSKASTSAKPKPAVSYTAKEDARWSLMKDEEGMPIKDLASGLDYYTDGLCDQERTVQETEIALQRRIDEMNAAASNASHDVFYKKRASVETFKEKLKTQVREYLGAAKLLEANLVIRNEIREPMLVFQAEAAVAEASKLKDGLLESADKVDELMNIAQDVAEAKLRREGLEAMALFDEVDETMVDPSSDACEDAIHEVPWTDEEVEAELIRAFDEEADEKLAAVDATKVVDSDDAFLAKVNAIDCPPGLSRYDCISQTDKDRYNDMLLSLDGDDDYEDTKVDSIFGIVDAVSSSTAESSLLKTDLSFTTDGFTGFHAGLKSVGHKPKVSSPLVAQPVLTLEDEVALVDNDPQPLQFDFSRGRATKAHKGIAGHNPKMFNAGSFSKLAKDLLEYQTHASTRKRSRVDSSEDAPVKKTKSSHDFSTSKVYNAPEPIKIDFLSGGHAPSIVEFFAGGLLTADFLEADEPEEAPEAPAWEPLTSHRKRSCSDDFFTPSKKLKMTHEFSVPEIQLGQDAPEPVDMNFLSGGCALGTVDFSAGGLLTAEFLEADEGEPTTSMGSLVCEPLRANRKRSRCDDGFTPSKKVKMSHDFSDLEHNLSSLTSENMATETHPGKDILEAQSSPRTPRLIKAMKGSRKAGPATKVFKAGIFTDALKDKTVVEPLPTSRKRSYSDDDGASIKRSFPTSDSNTPVKKAKLSASTTELVQTLLFDINAYVDGHLSPPSNTTTKSTVVPNTKAKAKYAANVGIWRNAISKTSGAKMDAVMGKIGGKKDGLGGLREKYLAGRGGKVGAACKMSMRKMARV